MWYGLRLTIGDPAARAVCRFPWDVTRIRLISTTQPLVALFLSTSSIFGWALVVNRHRFGRNPFISSVGRCVLAVEDQDVPVVLKSMAATAG